MLGLIITILLVAAGVGLYSWYYSEEQIVKRRLRNMPRTQIGQISDGAVVKLVGRVSFFNQPLIAPLSGRACAYYKVVVEEYRNSGKSGHWKTIIEETQGQDFLLVDESGQCIVRMVNAMSAVNKDANFRSGTFNDASPVLESFLARHGRSSTSFIGLNKSIRYKEGIFEANETVAVVGLARWEVDPAGYQWLTIYGNNDQPVMVSDDRNLISAY